MLEGNGIDTSQQWQSSRFRSREEGHFSHNLKHGSNSLGTANDDRFQWSHKIRGIQGEELLHRHPAGIG